MMVLTQVVVMCIKTRQSVRPRLLDLLKAVQNMSLKVEFDKLGVVLFEPIRENLHGVSLHDIKHVHGLDPPETPIDPPKDPSTTMHVDSIRERVCQIQPTLGLHTRWVVYKDRPESNQRKEPTGPCDMRDQSVVRLQGDLDLDGPKLVDNLEESHDQELHHKVADMVPDHDCHVGPPILDQHNRLVVA